MNLMTQRKCFGSTVNMFSFSYLKRKELFKNKKLKLKEKMNSNVFYLHSNSLCIFFAYSAFLAYDVIKRKVQSSNRKIINKQMKMSIE